MMNELLEKAMRLAGEVHKEQTDKAGKPYIFHLMRVAERAALNPIAIRVKMHDLEDNMDITRLERLEEKDLARLLNKYLRAYSYLKSL